MNGATMTDEERWTELVEDLTVTGHGFAANVKARTGTYRPSESVRESLRDEFGSVVDLLAEDRLYEEVTEDMARAAWEFAAEEWWYDTMPTIVREHGRDLIRPDDVHSEGRQGGWAVWTAGNRTRRTYSNWPGHPPVEYLEAWAEVKHALENAVSEGVYSYWWNICQMLEDRANEQAEAIGQSATLAWNGGEIR